MPEDIFADIPREGENPFKEEEKETPTESQPENKPEEEKPSQEGEQPKEEPKGEPAGSTPEENIPFHKHPRWIELQKDREQLRERVDELSRFREEVSPKLQELEEKKQPIPSWFQDTFGNNPDAWDKYQSYEKDLRGQIKDDIYREQEEYNRQQQESSQKWADWSTNQLQILKDEGLKFEQNELLKVLVEYKPVDDAGNLDFHKGYDILGKIKAAESVGTQSKTEAKKQIASQTMEGANTETASKDYRTPKDIRYKDWNDWVAL